MAFTDDIPDVANQVSADIGAIDDSLAHLKNCLEAICTGYSDSSTASLEVIDVADGTRVDDIKVNENVSVTATATELNLLDGVTATTAELNILDGVTSTAAELNTAADGISGPPLAGDSTAGRVVRSIQLAINDGGAADTIKCTLFSEFNGDTQSQSGDIAADGSANNFSLSATGEVLTIGSGVLTGNCVGVLSASVIYNASAAPLIIGFTETSNNIVLTFWDGANCDGSIESLPGLLDVGIITLNITYVTDA